METHEYQHKFPIESFALLTEDPAGLRTVVADLYRFFHPSTPPEFDLVDTMAMAKIRRGRVEAQLTEIVNDMVRQAVFRHDCAHEDEVERYKRMLATDPGTAMLMLRRSALGCRLLIGWWTRLLRLLAEEGTLYGADRDLAMRLQGACATPEGLATSEVGYLTY